MNSEMNVDRINTLDFVRKEIAESVETKKKLIEDPKLLETIAQITDRIIEAYRAGKKTMFAGNGGSAADAQHLAAEFVSRFYFD
jgi:D-sedoheptulose 7-phosphate isomerase